MSKNNEKIYDTKNNPFKSPEDYASFCKLHKVWGEDARNLKKQIIKNSIIPQPDIFFKAKKSKRLTDRAISVHN